METNGTAENEIQGLYPFILVIIHLFELEHRIQAPRSVGLFLLALGLVVASAPPRSCILWAIARLV